MREREREREREGERDGGREGGGGRERMFSDGRRTARCLPRARGATHRSTRAAISASGTRGGRGDRETVYIDVCVCVCVCVCVEDEE